MDRQREIADQLASVLAELDLPGDAAIPLRANGMSSMAIARLWLELQDRFAVELPLHELDGDLTVAELAGRIAAAPPARSAAPAAPELTADATVPLTSMQQSYLVGSYPEATADPVGCHQYLELRLRDVDPERLRRAWLRLVDRHEMLRSAVTADGRLRTLPQPPPWQLPVHDLSTMDIAAAAAALAGIRARIAHRSAGYAADRPFTIEVSLLGDGDHIVHVDLDCIAVDGHSIDLLLEEWGRLYRSSEAELDSPPDLTASSCLAAIAATAAAEGYQHDLAYWEGALAGLPAGPFPGLPTTTSADAPAGGYPRTALTARLDRHEWAALCGLALQAGASPTALALAVFADVLGDGRDPVPLVVTTTRRAQLPAESDRLVGPFTSTAVVLADPATAPTRQAAASALHTQLRAALEHHRVSGVEVLRRLRRAGRTVPESLPVVFTSMLGAAPQPAAEAGFTHDVCYAVSETSDVVLDCQLSERADELHIRWDVSTDRLHPGQGEALLAAFANGLRACAVEATAGTVEPLNPLQQAYFVARSTSDSPQWNGCQIYHSFTVSEVDAALLGDAIVRLVREYPALRRYTDAHGGVRSIGEPPRRWIVPVLDLTGARDPAAARDRLVDHLTGTAFRPGRWPAFDVRMTTGDPGATLHCAFDIAVFDAPSIHLLSRELVRFAADPRAMARPGPRRPAQLTGPAAPAGYWETRLAAIPAGPRLRATGGPGSRLVSSLPGWGRLCGAAAAHGVSADAVLFAAFTAALAAELDDHDFAVPVVRWKPGERPAELTALSWLPVAAAGTPIWQAARQHEALLAADRAADGVDSLGVLRRRVLRERAAGSFAFPVVYSSVVDVSAWPLPDGTAGAGWRSRTPDVSLDCIGVVDGDMLEYSWDAVPADLEPGLLTAAFGRYGSILAALVDDPDRDAAPVGTPRRDIMHVWNDTAASFPAWQLAHVPFETLARLEPDAVAVRSVELSLSYGELNAAANTIAWQLLDRGVGPGTIVAVATRRCPAMVAAVLGVLKAGAAYLPVEPSLPAGRAAVMLASAGATTILSTSDTTRWEEPDGCTVLNLDTGLPGGPAAANPASRATPDDLAYVIYTSGSTGTPKGVAVAHRSVANLVTWCRAEFGFGPTDTGLCVTSLGFDLSVFDILGLLGYGASVYVADETQQRDPALLLDIVLRERITFWNSAPTTLAQLAPLLPDAAASALRLVFLSGDCTPLSLPAQLAAAFPAARLVSLGGATEATVWSNFFPVRDIDPEWRSIPYGRPIANARYYVLDDTLAPCPVGVEGDLYIGGDVLAVGYYRDPARTAERFLPDPFAPASGARMYRTGDRALFFPDGNICFRGRGDGQVKIRGFRVELGEIEHCLRQHPAVREVVVLAVADGRGDKAISAYTIAAGTPPEPAELRGHVAARLPEYMVPNFVSFMDSFPATPNGKLDRDALAAPVRQAAPKDPAREPSGADIGELIAEVAGLFAGVLGVAAFDPAGDIWDQGATSFTVVQVSNSLQQRFGYRIPVAAVLAEPTAAGVAAHLRAQLGGAAADTSRQQSTVDFFAAKQRAEFKAGARNLRPRGGSTPVELDGQPPDGAAYLTRATRRSYRDDPVPAAALAGLLQLLRPTIMDGRARYRYPSAGDTYAVQVYVHVKPNRVDGIPAGTYYYRADAHQLEPLGPSTMDRSAHFYYNRDSYDQAAFELYLIGQSDAITPVYGDDAERYLAIEAGHIGQLLMTGQRELGIGLCQIGALPLDRLRADLNLDSGHRFLIGFLGGAALDHEAPHRVERRRDDLAVVGVAGRFPGAPDLDTLWHNLSTGRHATGPAPGGRLATAGAQQGGYLDRIDEFDSLLFRIAPAEAATLDPQLRLLLETVWTCLENAGHTADSLARTARRVGVFVATMWHDYELAGAEAAARTGTAAASATSSDIPNRISHFFGFTGPSVAVDTSCSSSLTALHLAARGIADGDCDAAVVAGVNLLAHPYHAELLRGWGLTAESPAGAFDEAAAGWLPGEGAAAVLLRPMAAADADRDTVRAVLEATWVGHTGGTGRFGRPDVAALADAIRETLRRADIAAADIGYVECAAAGAPVADSAEVEALARVLHDTPSRVPIGTVKPNIGHLEAAAGLSQLAKVILQFEHGMLAPTVVADRRGQVLPWEHLPVRVADTAQPWPAGRPRRALVNAASAAGSTAHAVLCAGPRRSTVDSQRGAQLVVLSAAGDPQLRALAGRIADHIRDAGPDLADVAFTLQDGRAQLSHRLAVHCDSAADLSAALAAYRDGRSHPALAVATVRPVGPGAAAREPRTTAEARELWLAGALVDWSPLWIQPAQRIPLPGYPFAGDRHWLAPPPVTATAARPGPQRPADPLPTLIQCYAEVSSIPPERIDPDLPLDHLGLSSVIVVALSRRLAQDFGDVPPTLFYENQTLRQVAGRLSPAGNGRPAPVSAPRRPRAADEPVAIIGIAGRYPGADDLDELWQLLAAGRDMIGPIPRDRVEPGWPAELMWGAFLDRVDEFDARFFGITGHDADLMDPQERLFLETVSETLEDAGYPRARLHHEHGGRVGVFAGTMYNDYPFFGVLASKPGTQVSTGSSVAGIANRVSYFLDLTGPSMTVDTMCSSSLTAIHLAVQSVRAGECAAAIAGGVNLSLHPNKFVEQQRLGMTATDHRCRAFGAGGDGFAPGEGVGAVLLKPLATALAAGDRVHAVITATAVNHGGRSNGYTVPNPAAQGALVAATMAAAGVPAATIGCIEAHGTGTALGDPVEIAGLATAFGDGAPPGSCSIGSVKSNIGHLEGAAGIAGLTKVVLQLRHRTLAPTLHVDKLNPNIEWEHTPFTVQRVAADWLAPAPAGARLPRRAGLSSFGAGGSNAHLIIEEAPAAEPVRVPSGPRLVVLSALDEAGLRVQAGRVAARIADLRGAAGDPAALIARLRDIAAGTLPPELSADSAAPQAVAEYLLGSHGPAADAEPLASVAYTLQVGREPLRERMAVVVDTLDELAAALTGFAAGDHRHVLRGRAGPAGTGTGPRPDLVGPVSADRAGLIKLARRWVCGEDTVAWDRLYPQGRPALADLPHYPFARRRHWLPEPGADGTDADAGLPCYTREWCPATAPAAVTELPAVVCLYREPTRELASRFAEVGRVTPIHHDDLASVELPAAAGLIDLCDLYAESGTPSPWRPRLDVLSKLSRGGQAVRCVLVVDGLQGPAGPRPTMAGAAIAGFVRALAAESSRLRTTVLDTDASPAEVLRQVMTEWQAADATEVCYRSGVRLLPELAKVRLGPPAELDPDQAYLITGGTGGIGSAVARRLLDLGATRLALLGHRPVRPRTSWTDPDLTPHEVAVAGLVTELTDRGAQVLLHTGALTRRTELAAFLARVRDTLGPIGGIVHCAGRISPPGPLSTKDSKEIAAVLEPKVDGLLALLDVGAADGADFVVLFSSLASISPRLAAGVAAYSAANAFLDFFAGYQARTGGAPVCSVAWPGWREFRMPGAADATGLGEVGTEQALAVLDRMIGGPRPAVVIVSPDPDTPEELLRGNDTEPPPAGAPDWLVAVVADTAGIPAGELDQNASFGELGVESVMLAELLRRIEARLGRPVEPALLLDHPSVAALAGHLADRAPADNAQPSSSSVVNRLRSTVDGEHKVAVIGMGCRFPGAPDISAFWANLVDGRCATDLVPASRWDAAGLYSPTPRPGRSISRWGGFVDGFEGFDPDYFGMTDDEATCLDPGIRLVLEVAAGCLADAGYAERELGGRAVGTFIGGRMSAYRDRIGIRAGSAGSGGDQNFLAARLAKHLDLTGPNLVVDTACSSSLVAVQLAVRSVLAGESQLAFAGGVDVLLDERPYLEFSALQALSPTGQCRAFDRKADGMVPGEGCGLLLLKRLDKAIADGDRIHAVINAAASGSDGRTMGLTTPNPAAQAAVVRAALAAGGMSADDIGMIEAHGTATPIGDPIELRALTTVFRESTTRSGYCAIGSVKSNIGHLFSAAGIAGLIKAVLAVGHGQLPPTLHCDEPNPRFDFADSPFYPNTSLRAWPDGPGVRAAGVSAFGLGGTNAHVIVSAPPVDAGTGRAPLPPPGFRRRRLWLDRRGRPEQQDGIVASLLDLEFVGRGEDRGDQ